MITALMPSSPLVRAPLRGEDDGAPAASKIIFRQCSMRSARLMITRPASRRLRPLTLTALAKPLIITGNFHERYFPHGYLRVFDIIDAL